MINLETSSGYQFQATEVNPWRDVNVQTLTFLALILA